MGNNALRDPDLSLHVTTNKFVKTRRRRRESISQHGCGLVYHFEEPPIAALSITRRYP
jgi:hypothetical protein